MVKSNRPAAHDNSDGNAGVSLHRRWALLIAAVTLGLLLRDVVTDLMTGDAGEFQFAAWRWGLAHATGYPLYLLVGGAWQRVWSILGLSPALALNALSAVFTAAAAGLFFLLLLRWLSPVLLPPTIARLAAGLGVAFLIANPTLRTQSIQAEVYSLHLLLMIAILLAATRLAASASPGEGQDSPPPPTSAGHRSESVHPLILLALLVGLSLAHHATTVLLLPPLLAYLALTNRNWRLPLRTFLWAGGALLLPMLLYLYIPLRSDAQASPWYHQPLGDGVLSLYTGGWQSFVAFVSGRSISVGYYTAGEAWTNLPMAGLLWLRHFEWAGLLLMALGLFVLVRLRQWPLLALTLGYVALHQLFNLFYAIGDIFVYYIPLYLIGCVWISFGAAGIGTAFRLPQRRGTAGGAPEPHAGVRTGQRADPHSLTSPWSVIILLALLGLPAQIWLQYSPLLEQLQAESDAARALWEEVMAAGPPPASLLVSNDRNEIVPLFYLQNVEGRGVGLTGLFPLVAPDARFADIGATVQTALDAASAATPPLNVYLVKPMDGLEARFDLAPAAPPLVQVTGAAAGQPPAERADADYGPLRLLGYDWQPGSGEGKIVITLHWQVTAAPAADYTTTVQLFDAAGSKLAQDDRRAGGDYYPSSLWKPGETLLDRHTLMLPAGAGAERLLVGMYSGPDAALLAPPLEIDLGN